MAVNNYVFTAGVTLAAGTAATVVAGEPETAGAAGFGSKATTGGPTYATTYVKGQLIALDPAGPLFALIGGGNLQQVTPAQETGGNYGTAN